VPLSRGETPIMPRTRRQRQRLQERIDALHDGGSADGDLSLLALAIPPRGMAILETVGGHPLLPATDIARVCDLNPVDAWDLLGRLCRYGLAAAWTPPGKRRTRRYVLTARGLRLLAARAGLAPDAYRRIYAALDETAGGARRGLRFAQRNLAHTDGINSVYLALLAAARAAGGSLTWRGEWACARRYPAGQRLRTLRPDAEARYAGPSGTHHLFVEVDRGTKRSHALAGQLTQYATYHASSGRDRVMVLLVTMGNERGWELLCLNETLPERVGMPPLDLLVTTRAEIAERGVQAHIWRATSGPCATLHVYLNTMPTQAGLQVS
jgi:DNA-binding MarR family transcriptional regulator